MFGCPIYISRKDGRVYICKSTVTEEEASRRTFISLTDQENAKV